METPNRSIKCNVESCRNHCGSEDYCSLSCITVGTHECNPTQDACTDCMSFVKSKGKRQIFAPRLDDRAGGTLGRLDFPPPPVYNVDRDMGQKRNRKEAGSDGCVFPSVE